MKVVSIDPRFRATLARDRGFSMMGVPMNSPLARVAFVAENRPSNPLHHKTVQPTDVTFIADTLPDVAAGKPRAMNLCIARHGGVVWAIVRRSVAELAEAEDLVQEIFTEVWKKAASFDPAMSGECTFVGMIARRRTIDFLRRRGRQPGFEPLEAAESMGHDPWEACPVIGDADAVRSSLANLPDETRELFHLFFEKGYTHPQIAEKTGLPLGTIKTRLRRGLIALREQLQRTGNINPAMSP